MSKQTWAQWARACAKDPSSPSLLKKGSLAALTGDDVRALDAFVPLLEIFVHTEDKLMFVAARIVLDTMQPSTRWIACELIPFVRNWEDRELWWPQINKGRNIL